MLSVSVCVLSFLLVRPLTIARPHRLILRSPLESELEILILLGGASGNTAQGVLCSRSHCSAVLGSHWVLGITERLCSKPHRIRNHCPSECFFDRIRRHRIGNIFPDIALEGFAPWTPLRPQTRFLKCFVEDSQRGSFGSK